MIKHGGGEVCNYKMYTRKEILDTCTGKSSLSINSVISWMNVVLMIFAPNLWELVAKYYSCNK